MLRQLDQRGRPILTAADFREARIALMRFGLGPKPLLPTGIAWTPQKSSAVSPVCQAWLDELEVPNIAVIDPAGLPSYAESALGGTQPTNAMIAANNEKEFKARYWKFQQARVGFVERLVLFWANHFSASHEKCARTRATVVHLERGVIRLHALGNFSAMLKAVMQHTAMMMYLDNVNNYAPGGATVKNRPGFTYNENLGREILDLHTLGTIKYGTDSVLNFSRADVKNLTAIMTGWNVWGSKADRPSTFRYEESWSDTGTQTLLGRTYNQKGIAKGLAALDDLAKHRETSYHLARKLLVHFVKDDPSAAMIEALAEVFYDERNSPDQLKKVAQKLILMDESWTEPMTRIRQPHLWLVSLTRALNISKQRSDSAIPNYRSWLSKLHHEQWAARQPNGYSDYDLDWRDPGTFYLRMAAAAELSKEWVTDADLATLQLEELYDMNFPAVRSTAAKNKIRQLAQQNRRQALAYMSMTPQFLVR